MINAGTAGDRAEDLSDRLERDVLRHQPAVVLLFIGGNDYFERTPRARLAAGLEAIASRITAAGARLVIVEVPTGIVWNQYAGLYRRIANRYGAILVPESRLRLWYSAELLARGRLAEPLTSDGIHLSPAGAIRVADWLAPYARAALSMASVPTAPTGSRAAD